MSEKTAPNKGLLVIDGQRYSVDSVLEQVQLLQMLKSKVLIGPTPENPAGVHYGKIPGCGDKDVLLKPGAEKMCLVFGLRMTIDPQKDVTIMDIHDCPGHREYRIFTHLYNRKNEEVATGVGSATTLEGKYAFRMEVLDNRGPDDYKDKKAEYKARGYGFRKLNGEWKWCNLRAPNPNIADVYNTVFKIAKKRSYVDGTITATGSGDFFTQDLDDMSGLPGVQEAEVVLGGQPAPKAEPTPAEKPVEKPTEKPAEKPAKTKKTEKKEEKHTEPEDENRMLAVMEYSEIDGFEVRVNKDTNKKAAKMTFGDIVMYCTDEAMLPELEKLFNAGTQIKVQFDQGGAFKKLVNYHKLEAKA